MTVVTTHGVGDDPEGLARHLSNCDRVISIPYVVPKRGSAALSRRAASVRGCRHIPVDLWKWQVPEVRAQVQTLMDAGVDLVVADFLFASMNVPMDGSAPVVLFEHNVEYQIWQRLAALERRPWIRPLLEVEWRKLRAREADACRRADLTIAVSADDRRRLERLAPGIDAASIPTGVDTDYFTPMPQAERPAHLVFSGSMDWHPNEDAVLYFLDVDPAVDPRARFPRPRSRSSAATHQRGCATPRDVVGGVTVTGTVSDVRPSIAEGAVYVVPLRAGGGTRLKIFEALAMARPVVSTTVGAEGLGIGPGLHYTCADEPRAFADAVVVAAARPGAPGAAGRPPGVISSRPATRGRRLAVPSNNDVKRWLPRMRMHAEAPTVVLICHEEERLDREGLASWLASTMKLAGLLIIRDRGRRWRAVRRELTRVGPLGLLDVAAFRAYARVVHGARDRTLGRRGRWSGCARAIPANLDQVPQRDGVVAELGRGDERSSSACGRTSSIARCKMLLRKDVFEIPRAGTFVLHPGICPEYRNAHGCFWALANRDLDRVGMTLLRVDAGIDTGPVYLHGTCDYDERRDSHIVIQQRAVVDNLDAIGRTLTAIARGEDVRPVNTDGRRSAVWGQPRLTHYLRWKLAARRTPRCRSTRPRAHEVQH